MEAWKLVVPAGIPADGMAQVSQPPPDLLEHPRLLPLWVSAVSAFLILGPVLAAVAVRVRRS